MEIEERKLFRKIYLSYSEIIKLFKIPSDLMESATEGITIGVWENKLKVWSKKIHSLDHWAVTFSMAEVKDVLKIHLNEKLTDTEYIGGGYYFIIETTEESLQKIENGLQIIRGEKGVFGKLFSNTNPRKIGILNLRSLKWRGD